jgi:hypothetical protein
MFNGIEAFTRFRKFSWISLPFSSIFFWISTRFCATIYGNLYQTGHIVCEKCKSRPPVAVRNPFMGHPATVQKTGLYTRFMPARAADRFAPPLSDRDSSHTRIHDAVQSNLKPSTHEKSSEDHNNSGAAYPHQPFIPER